MSTKGSNSDSKQRVTVDDFVDEVLKGVQIVIGHMKGRKDFPALERLQIDLSYEDSTELGVDLLVFKSNHKQIEIKEKQLVLKPDGIVPTPPPIALAASHMGEEIPTSYEASSQREQNFSLVPFYLDLASDLMREIAKEMKRRNRLGSTLKLHGCLLKRSIFMVNSSSVGLTFKIFGQEDKGGVSVSGGTAVAQKITLLFGKMD